MAITSASDESAEKARRSPIQLLTSIGDAIAGWFRERKRRSAAKGRKRGFNRALLALFVVLLATATLCARRVEFGKNGSRPFGALSVKTDFTRAGATLAGRTAGGGTGAPSTAAPFSARSTPHQPSATNHAAHFTRVWEAKVFMAQSVGPK